jgi:Snf7
VTPAERLRQHQRSLAKAQRELDRERTKLEQQEKKLIADIKKSAKAGQLVSRSFLSVIALWNVDGLLDAASRSVS